MRWFLLSAMALCGLVLACGPASAATSAVAGASPTIRQVDIDGAIGPATSHYIKKQFHQARDNNAELILLRIDTPGGLSRATHKIVKAILASPIPVVGFVAPSGARAASAGTYIMYATHIAAMTPASHLGAATPVSMGGSPAPSPSGSSSSDENKSSSSGQSSASAERRKVVNDAVAFIRSLANKRGRNADWAEKAVRHAATLTADEALHDKVIDLIADNRGQLLHKLDGMTVQTTAGSVTLTTDNAQIVQEAPGWRTELLGIITQPTFAYLLMLIGIFGLLFEGLNPGAILPGVLGGICLLVALYAFQILPVNYAGLGLIALGVIMLVGEMFMPSFGALGLGGIAAFTFGSVMLMDTSIPGYGIPLGIIIGLGIGGSLLILLIVGLFHRSRRQRVRTGGQGLVGSHCLAMSDFERDGRVWLHGESWQAHSEVPVRKNDVLTVVSSQGLTVNVRPANRESQS